MNEAGEIDFIDAIELVFPEEHFWRFLGSNVKI